MQRTTHDNEPSYNSLNLFIPKLRIFHQFAIAIFWIYSKVYPCEEYLKNIITLKNTLD